MAWGGGVMQRDMKAMGHGGYGDAYLAHVEVAQPPTAPSISRIDPLRGSRVLVWGLSDYFVAS